MLILLTLNHSQPFKNHPIINNRITLKGSNKRTFFFTENHKLKCIQNRRRINVKSEPQKIHTQSYLISQDMISKFNKLSIQKLGSQHVFHWLVIHFIVIYSKINHIKSLVVRLHTYKYLHNYKNKHKWTSSNNNMVFALGFPLYNN